MTTIRAKTINIADIYLKLVKMCFAYYLVLGKKMLHPEQVSDRVKDQQVYIGAPKTTFKPF